MKKPFLILFVAVNAALGAGFVFAEGTLVRAVLAALVFLFNSLNYAWIHASCSRAFREVAGLGEAIAANRFDAALSGSPLLDSEGLGKSLGALEEGLKKRLSLDEAMLANIIVPMALVDQKGNITWMNESMVTLTENTGPPASYLGRHFSEFFYGDSRETLAEKALREQSRQMAKTEFDTRKGTHKFISVAATPIKDFDGRVMGGFVTVADFTNIVLKERQITDQNARIAQAVAEACEVAQRVAEAAAEMERRIGQTSQGMQNQRFRTDEVAAAIEEMNATILEVARNAGDAASTAAKASETTRKGTELVQKVTGVMDALSAKAAGLKTEMEDLGRQAQGIGQIMQVISDIADQTNLLALNAAIEAARAGDAGRGFAVVADEVRKLAEKTMTATREVGGYITAIQDSTKRNMLATDDTTRGIGEAEGAADVAGEALRQIMDYVERTTDQVRGIATAAEQQSSTSEEINRSTHDIHQIAGETAEAMTQAAGAVAQLSGLAADLNAAMEHMRQE